MSRLAAKCKFRIFHYCSKSLTGGKENFLYGPNNVFRLVQRRFLASNKLWDDQTGFEIPVPEFDWDYLCDENKKKEIEANIRNRKGVGDIEKVTELWRQWKGERNDEQKSELLKELNTAAAAIPNRSNPNSPIGEEDKAETVEIVGNRREFDFKPRSIVDIGEGLGLLRTKNLTYTCSHRAYYFLGDLAHLERALIQFTLDRVIKNGFSLISVPDIINSSIIEACGFPTTGEKTQVYSLDYGYHGNDRLCLAGTSEMPIAGCFMNQVIDGKDLPQKNCAVSRCYRAEASNALEEQGIYRVHEFTKVEMFAITTPEQSEQMLQDIIGIERDLFAELGLYYRVLNMPTHELGAPAYQKYDIETWMPALSFWGEISSASNCTDFQSRRLNIKYRTGMGDKPKHVHTINGTACAIPRLIMAIVENNQQSDGSVEIPRALQSYMNGKNKLESCDFEKKSKFSSKPIELCLKERAQYTCPRCNTPYCSVGCYQAEGHMTCSESFYKECFMEGLENQDVSSEEKKKMLEMLQRVEQENQEDLDSDDDEEDLHERLAGLDLDRDAEEIWNRLTDKEKADFQKMTADGRLGNLVEIWTPWWQVKENKIQELDKESSKSADLPSIVKDIPDIASLLKNTKPSADIKNNIVNILYAYAFICRLHNGDHMTCCIDSAKDLLAVCEVLDKNVICISAPQAVQYCMKCIQQNPSLTVPQDFQASVIHDVIRILRGRSDSEPLTFVLRALSQVHDIICKCQRANKKKQDSQNGEDDSILDRKKLSGIKKKLLFLLGWTERFGMALHPLIPELQLEYSALQSDLKEQGLTQHAIEKNFSGLRSRPPAKPLIQELNQT